MTQFLRALSALFFCAFLISSASGGAKVSPTQAELEFAHTMMIYEGYIGERDEQKQNMLELTIARLERTKKMHEDTRVRNHAFLHDMENFGASLFATRHMMRARDRSKEGKQDAVKSELTQACRYAKQTTHLDPRLQETCQRFRKYGYVRMT